MDAAETGMAMPSDRPEPKPDTPGANLPSATLKPAPKEAPEISMSPEEIEEAAEAEARRRLLLLESLLMLEYMRNELLNNVDLELARDVDNEVTDIANSRRINENLSPLLQQRCHDRVMPELARRSKGDRGPRKPPQKTDHLILDVLRGMKGKGSRTMTQADMFLALKALGMGNSATTHISLFEALNEHRASGEVPKRRKNLLRLWTAGVDAVVLNGEETWTYNPKLDKSKP